METVWKLPTRQERMEAARQRYRKWGTPRGVGRPGQNHLWVKYPDLPWFRTCDGVVRRDIRGIRAPKHMWPKAWCQACLDSLSWREPVVQHFAARSAGTLLRMYERPLQTVAVRR